MAEIGGLWRLLPHEAIPAERKAWEEDRRWVCDHCGAADEDCWCWWRAYDDEDMAELQQIWGEVRR